MLLVPEEWVIRARVLGQIPQQLLSHFSQTSHSTHTTSSMANANQDVVYMSNGYFNQMISQGTKAVYKKTLVPYQGRRSPCWLYILFYGNTNKVSGPI